MTLVKWFSLIIYLVPLLIINVWVIAIDQNKTGMVKGGYFSNQGFYKTEVFQGWFGEEIIPSEISDDFFPKPPKETQGYIKSPVRKLHHT